MANSTNAPLDGLTTNTNFLKELDLSYRLIKRILSHRPKTGKKQYGQRSIEFRDYRPYVPGDDLHRVDWNVFRRLNELVIREYAIEIPKFWILGMDISPSMLMYQKENAAARLVIAILYIALSLNDKAAFFPFPTKKQQFFQYQNRQNISRMFYHFEQLKYSQFTPAGYSFRHIFTHTPKRAQALLVSDFYDKSSLDFFLPAKSRNMPSYAIQIIAEEEHTPSITGDFILHDIENHQHHRKKLTSQSLKNYKKRFQEHINQVKSFCHQHNVIHTTITPNASLNQVLMKLFQLMGLSSIHAR